MWRLLKADVDYDRLRINLFLFLSAIAFLAIWIGVKWERNRVPMVMLMVLVLTLTAVYAGERYRTAQKRDRLHVLLPVPLWQIGVTHLLYPLVFLAAVYFLLFLSVVVCRPLVDYALVLPSLAHMLTLTGLVLILNAVLLIQRDLRMTLTSRPLGFLVFLIWLLVYIGALLPFYVITDFMGVFGEGSSVQLFINRMLESSAGFIGAGLFLSGLSLVVFVRRQSYTDS